MAKKKNSEKAVCKLLEKMIGDEHKSKKDYLKLKQMVTFLDIPRSVYKLSISKALGSLSKEEARHEREVIFLHRKLICPRLKKRRR